MTTVRGMLLGLALTFSSAEGYACVAPATYAGDVVQIERAYADVKKVSSQGTGWFYRSRQLLVTNAHVVAALELSASEWRVIRMHAPHATVETNAKILGTDEEKDIALVALAGEFPNVRLLGASARTVRPGAHISVAGYGAKVLNFGEATVYDEHPALTAESGRLNRLEIYVPAASNLDAFASGASGSPIFDCSGGVVGILHRVLPDALITSMLPPGQQVYRPSPRRSPNALAARVEDLEYLYWRLHGAR